jgi:glycerophosphoryl diester phosphodiesterase
MPSPITFAHRGGRWGDVLENSLPAFRRALELGASGLESDVRLAADGEAVLVHGPFVRRGVRRLKVATLTSARLGEVGIPRLTDLYAELGNEFELSLDLKVRGVAAPVLAAARAAGALSRLWLCSPDLEELQQVRQADGDVRLVHTLHRRAYGDALEGHAAALVRQGVAALNLRDREWSLGLVILAHRFALRAFAWDVQDARRMRALLSMGLDALYSDDVARLVGVVAEWTPGDPD